MARESRAGGTPPATVEDLFRDRGLLTLQHDEKSGGYIIQGYTSDE
jgi:hypothetical protein